MLTTKNSDTSWEWHTTFIGTYMAHSYRLHYIIDSLFQNNHFHSVIEIGTGHGALTLVLGLWGKKLDIPVMSLDIDDTMYDKKMFQLLDIEFIKADEFSQEAMDKVCAHFNAGPVLLVCDGGLKKWEFNTFAPLTPAGSVICTHDWGNELRIADIDDTVSKYCEPYQEDRWNEMNVQFATFKRRSTNA